MNNSIVRRQLHLESASTDTQSHCCLDVAGSEDEDRELPSWLLPFVPEVSPLPWTLVNNALAGSGCLLIVDLFYTNENYGNPNEERPFATAFFLWWEFATCFFWAFETGLSAAYQHWHLHESFRWHTSLELSIAVYFMVSTFRMLWRWNLLQYDEDEIWEIALDTSFYVYLAARSCERGLGQAEEATARDIEDLEEQMEEPYQIMEISEDYGSVTGDEPENRQEDESQQLTEDQEAEVAGPIDNRRLLV